MGSKIRTSLTSLGEALLSLSRLQEPPLTPRFFVRNSCTELSENPTSMVADTRSQTNTKKGRQAERGRWSAQKAYFVTS